MSKSRSEKRKRTLYIRARVTPEEKLRFLNRCESSGFIEADYIRAACLDAKPLRAVRKQNIDQELLTIAVRQISRYGNNLNQIARKLNQSQRFKRKDRHDLQSALEALKDLHTIFRQALGYDL